MGTNTRYQRKYWEVQTLLKVTKAKVCESMARGREGLEMVKGMRRVERVSWGMKARDSNRRLGEMPLVRCLAEERYRSVLYGLKLWRWSIRVRWCR
jgi:hypothetical protein